MTHWRKIIPVLLVVLGFVSLALPGAFAQGSSLQVQTPLEKALAGVGGEDAVSSLDRLAIESGGTRWVRDEGFTPGGQAGMIGPFEVQFTYDIAGDALRLDYVMQSIGNERQVSEVIAGELGYLDGMNANFGAPGISNMSSDRWASIRKHQRLLNPHLILQDILADPGSVSEGGEVLLDGSVHHTLVVEDEVAPMTLYVNAGTGRLAKLTTMENDGLRRDVPVEVFYYGWQPVGEDLFFPAELYVAYDGEIVHKEIRSTIEVNPEIDSALFEFPADSSPVFDEDLAARGASHHQYLQTFAAFGFPRDGFQPQVNAQELAPGVFHLTGGSHHSLAIEQEDGIVIAEAPLDEIRSQAVIDWVETTFPDKSISHAVSSHHHVDHSAGLRTYVAQGVTAVMHETAAPFFEEVFLAGSTVVSDPLAENPVPATIETVEGDGPFIISDATNSVEVYRIENTHAEDMVITFVPEAGVIFLSDLYSPNPNAPSAGPGGIVLNEAITGFDLDVSTIAGGHGGTITFEDFEALLGQ
jgi:glyoxylase-like metal-dependent hydrolase (beta-lactamase superfamily II)